MKYVILVLLLYLTASDVYQQVVNKERFDRREVVIHGMIEQQEQMLNYLVSMQKVRN